MPVIVTRRAFALAGAAALALTAARAGAAGLDPFRVSIIPISDVTPLFVAMRRGFFAEEGLAVDTSPSAGGATGVPGLVAGSYDVAYGNVVTALLAARQGLDVRIVAAGTKVTDVRTDRSAIVARRDGGVRTGRDLEGRSVAVNTRNNVIWLYARAWIKATGGDPDRVTFKEVPHPQMEDAIRQGQVDAGFMVLPYVDVALGKPDLVDVAHPYSAVQPGVEIGQYLATASALDGKADALLRFGRALRRGTDWYNDHLTDPDLLPIVSGFTRIDVDVLKAIALPPAPTRVDPAEIDKTMRLMVEQRLLKAPLDVKPVIAPMALA